MKIRYWGILFFLLIMLTAAGCERKSVEDIRSMEETKLVGESGSEVSDISYPMEKRIEVFNGSNSSSDSVDSGVKYAEKNEKTDVIGDSKGRNTFSIIYEDSAIARNVDELSKLMSDEDIEQLKTFDSSTAEKFTAYDKKIKEDGTFSDDRMGMKQVAVLFKVKIINTKNEEFKFNSMGYKVYCFKNIDGVTRYTTISEGFSYMNIHDSHEIFTNNLTLRAGETKEIVMMELIPYELVTAYTKVQTNADGQYNDTYKDIITDGVTVDSLYTCYSITRKAFPTGSPVFKLDND